MEGSLKYHLDTLTMFKTVCPGVRNCAIAGCLKNIGKAYEKLGDANQALKYFEEAMEMERSLFSGQNHPDIAESLSGLGSVNEKLGNGAAAVKYYEDALEARRALHPGQNHADITFSLCSLGWAHEKLGNDAVALKYYEDALEMQKALDGNYNGTGWILDQVGAIYFKLKDTEGIIKNTEQCLEMKLKYYDGQNHTLIANSFSNLGHAYESFGDHHKAAEYFKVAFLMDAKTEGSPDFMEHTKEVVESKYPDFIKNGETREFIRQRGSFDASTLQIKQKLQEPVLNEICEASSGGRWGSDSSSENRGVKDYLEESYLCQQLGSLSSPETVEKAKMLCFEAVCLGIMGSASQTKNFTCAKEFTNAYPKVVENITRDHPEYFVDGSILRQCVNDTGILNKLLGSANQTSQETSS